MAWCRPSDQRRAGHEPTGELVHDQHFTVLDHIIHVTLEQGMGPKA